MWLRAPPTPPSDCFSLAIRHGERKAVLREWCQEFHLPFSGNVADLTSRLKAFSGDRENWDGILPGARRPHKGPRIGTKVSKAKVSARRRELLLGRGVANSTAVVHALPTERSRDMRTAEQISQLIPWVSPRPVDARCYLDH